MNPGVSLLEKRVAAITLTLLLATGASNVIQAQVPDGQVRTFVLVHGAWHGGWAWDPVVARLRERGHTVFAPTLTGLDDGHQTPVSDIDLSTHIDDILSVLEQSGASDIILVGHSYAGIVIAGVLGKHTGRIAKAIFLDAVIPYDGQTFMQSIGTGTIGTLVAKVLATFGQRMPPPSADSWEQRWGITGAHREYLAARIRGHPPLTLVEPVNWRPAAQPEIEFWYVRCEQNTDDAFGDFAEAARADPRWSYVGLDSHHDAMLVAPDELTTVLVEIAR